MSAPTSDSSATIPAGKDIYAILIAIENYPNEEDRLPGSLQDLENVLNYLHKRGVRDSCIKVLKDEEATRQSILNLWQTHLTNNPEIRKDDPILIYFSGHGTQDDAPEQWQAAGLEAKMEMFLPYDSLIPDDGSADVNCAIPDRTIGALLRQLAKAKGNNITTVFDCCNSGHINRKGHILPPELRFSKRVIDPRRLKKKITADVDREIWNSADAQEPDVESTEIRHRGAVLHRQNNTHVHLAACKRDESTYGNPRGGLFTRSFLAALADFPDEDVSYDRLITRIHQHYHRIFDDEQHIIDEYLKKHNMSTHDYEGRPLLQTPQCEGIDRSRLLWRRAGDTQKSYTVQPFVDSRGSGPSKCQIHVGSTAGIKVGTVFQLNQLKKGRDADGRDEQLGSVIVSEVHDLWCLATMPSGMEISSESVRAVITTLGGPLRFWIENKEPNSYAAVTNAGSLERVFSKRTEANAVLAPSKDVADVILFVDAEGVFVSRKDPQLDHLNLEPPFVHATDIFRVFPAAFQPMARFHDFLSLSNQSSPFASSVELSLHHLEETIQSPASSIWDENNDFRAAGDELEPKNNQIVITQHGEDILYAVVLKNHSDKPLFPHVMWFDPMTYTIQTFYTPMNPDSAPLPARSKPEPEAEEDVQDQEGAEAGEKEPNAIASQPADSSEEDWQPGRLQLGRSSECHDAMWFELPRDQKQDTGLLKVFLASGAMNLTRMEQPKIFGYNDKGQPEIVANGGQANTRGGEALTESWDTITRIITVTDP